MAQPNLQEIHDVLVDIAKRAGEKITSARPSVGAIDTKKNCERRSTGPLMYR